MNSTAQKIETSIEVQGLCLNQTNKLISEAWWKNCSLENKTTKHSIGCHQFMIVKSEKDNK